MNVSVIITCLNEKNNIATCLSSLVHQEGLDGTYEIIVCDGGSLDGTQEIIKEFAKQYSEVRLVVEGKKGTSAGRNAALKEARYDHVAFIDADCEAPRDWLLRLILKYQEAKKKDSNLIAVGGKNIPPKTASLFVKAIGIALDSYLGSFNSPQGRQFVKPTYVISLATVNALYEKKKIFDAGCFDETLFSEGEDADLNYRLSLQGYTLLFCPDSFVFHNMRATPQKWFKNMFRYGKARARLLKRYRSMWGFSYCLPVLFLIAFVLVIFATQKALFYLPLLYFPLLLLFSMLQAVCKKVPCLMFHIMLVYIVQHFAYASGEVYGLLNPRVK
ncbi:MAG: glycosyltransferase [Candidatus Omnitrophica bacterium]|nr:glycosyltransferase [Candidatus Omnitrophota bacterium]